VRIIVLVKHCPLIIFWTKDPAAVRACASGAFAANSDAAARRAHSRASPYGSVPPPEWDGPRPSDYERGLQTKAGDAEAALADF
jgi:hypothetical protein